MPNPISHEQLVDICKLMDINKDGQVDLNEFLETFRLVDNEQRRYGGGGIDMDAIKRLAIDRSPAVGEDYPTEEWIAIDEEDLPEAYRKQQQALNNAPQSSVVDVHVQNKNGADVQTEIILLENGKK